MKYLALVALLFASPALGQGQIGDWEVIATADNCIASKTVFGTAKPTTLALGATFDGAFGIVLMNEGWSTQPREYHDMYLLIDQELIEGRALAGDGSLFILIRPDLLGTIARADRLTAFLVTGPDSEQMIEQFQLNGSAAAITELRECAIEQAGFRDAERRRAELIPADPFTP